MRASRFRFGWLIFYVLSILFIKQIYAAEAISSKQFLLNQVLLGEVNYKDDLVQQSLSRLELIAPLDPEVLAANLRLALRQGKRQIAQDQLEKLKQVAPQTPVYERALISFNLFQPQSQHTLQQARIFGMTGHLDEAKAQYDVLFHGDPPTPELAAEYWKLVSRIPAEQKMAFIKLQELYVFLQSRNVLENTMIEDNWQNSFKRRLSSLWEIDADEALKKGNLASAEQQYRQAILMDNTNDSAWVGIGDIEFARKNYKVAEEAYKKALLLYPGGISAVYGLVHIYKLQSPQKALAYMEGLSESQKLRAVDTMHALQGDIVEKEADRLIKLKQWAKAIEKYKAAQKLDPDNVWLMYDLATALFQVGKVDEANRLFSDFVKKQKNDPKAIYPYALYLSKANQDARAVTVLNSVPKNRWDSSMQELSARLVADMIMKQAQTLRETLGHQAAVDYLLRQTPTIKIKLALADWAAEDGQFTTALNYYRQVKAQDPANVDALLGEVEVLVLLKQIKEARYLLVTERLETRNLSMNMQRRVANAWVAVGEPRRAAAVFARIKRLALPAAPSQDTALVFRDSARFEVLMHQPQLAFKDSREAMVKSGITSIYPADNATYTRLTRVHPGEEWLKRGIRSDAENLYRQQEFQATLDEDYWTLAGTPGYSDFTARDTLLEIEKPLYDGRFFLRGEAVTLTAGDFVPVDGFYVADFGTCGTNACSSGIAQRARGFGIDAGWRNNTWGVDLGHTPIGFDVSNWIGRISYSGDFRHIGWTLAALQRPIINSLLSFAGTVDPNFGVTWGGVVVTGANLSVSYDRGEANGFWANLGAGQLTGKNVLTNQRVRLMDGFYHKFINEDNRRFSLGLNNMLWYYAKDLSGYTLGQGGYFSPHKYFSVSVPANYRKRTDNWSYELGGSISWSHTTSQDSFLYPLPNLVPGVTDLQNSIQSPGPGSGFGFTFLAVVERRISTHFICGAALDIQRSRDYTPSHASIFLRYSLEGWQGDLDMPIPPVIPYADFR